MTVIARRDDLVSALRSYNVTPDQVLAVPLVASGASDDVVARRLGISKSVVRRWRTEDPAFIDAVDFFRNNYAGWYKDLVQRAVVDALTTLINVMSLPEDGNPSTMRSKMSAAKIVLSVYEKSVQNINLNFSSYRPSDNYTPESIEVLSQRLGALGDEDDVEDGEIVVSPHPDATYGHVVRDGSGRIICHVCGARVRRLVDHSVNKHGIDESEYRRMFGIPDGADLE